MATGSLRPEYRRLYEKAWAAAPEHVAAEPERYWVAILYHNVDPVGVLCSEDFLWVKSRDKTVVGKIPPIYPSKDSPTRDVSWLPVLVINGTVVNSQTKLKELDFFGQRFICFRALDPKSTEAIIAAGVPQLGSTDAIKAEALIASTLTEQQREPLQPIQRALNQTISPPPAATPVKGENSQPDEHRLPEPRTLLNSHDRTYYPDLKHNHMLSPGCAQRGHHYQPVFAINNPSPAQPKLEPNEMANVIPQLLQHGDEFKKELDHGEDSDNEDEDYFNDETQESQNDDGALFHPTHLQQLIKTVNPEVLEQGVQEGLMLLDRIKTTMATNGCQQAETTRFLTQIENLQNQAIRSRTIVGVVGNTGAGKSSVINAVLEEEKLLPTNCLRACTAVVTEVSWNDNDDLNYKYRAEIEFIKEADWAKELKILFDDLLNDNGEVSRDATSTSDTEAGVAYAKLKAVYPKLTKDTMEEISIDQLLRHSAVQNLFGTVKYIHQKNPDWFYQELQKFVDSKDKGDEKSKKEPKAMEYWPLIKQVRIFAKADALSTGAVIVDLPGVHDSNAARAAVAQRYLKECTRLWVVAPINRAVDDKAAKKLLGDQFRRQLKLDGTYDSVTFIASKTDDINLTEASEIVDDREVIEEMWDELQELEGSGLDKLKEKRKDLTESRAIALDVLNDQDALYDKWETLLEQFDAGETIYAPREDQNPRKRKGSPKAKKTKKKAHFSASQDDNMDDFIVDDEDDATESEADSDVILVGDEADEEQQGEPLTRVEIKKKLDDIKAAKAEARRSRADLGKRIEEVKQEMKVIDQKIKDLNSKIAGRCIKGRNVISRSALQDDFAQGIKELDQENAIEEDEDKFDPEEDIRDYREVAKSLPVFCVSSKAYQKLCGRLRKDKMPHGFEAKEDTEIPQLQAHCKQLTEATRVSACRGFLNNISLLLNSLGIWSSNDGTGARLSDRQHQAETNWLNKRLTQLERAFDKAVADGVDSIKQTLVDNLFEYYPNAVTAAREAAEPTASHWGDHPRAGGLYWATYKALCRREGGPFTGSRGGHDFNAQLAEPLERLIANRWETCFQRRMPKVLQSFKIKVTKMIKQFHDFVERRARDRGTGAVGLPLLYQLVQNTENTFAELAVKLTTIISNEQKDASRHLVPVVAAAMAEGYGRCVAESGPGSFNRMKSHMLGHIENVKKTMFDEAVDVIKEDLRRMRLEVEQEMANQVEAVFQVMRREYVSVIIGEKLPEGYVMPKQERTLRHQVADLVKEADETFRKVVIGEGDEGMPVKPEPNAGGEKALQAPNKTVNREVEQHGGSAPQADAAQPPVAASCSDRHISTEG